MKNTAILSLTIFALATACGGTEAPPSNPNNTPDMKTDPTVDPVPGMLPMQRSDLVEAFEGTIDSLEGFVPAAPTETAYQVGTYDCTLTVALKDQRENIIAMMEPPQYNPTMHVAYYMEEETGRYALHMQGGPSIFHRPIYLDELENSYSWAEGNKHGWLGFVEQSKRDRKLDKHHLLIFDHEDNSNPNDVITVYRWYTTECSPQ